MSLLRLNLLCIAVALPWINPFATGPSSVMVPWLVSLACVGLALALAPGQAGFKGLSRGLVLFFGVSALYFALRMLWQGTSVEALATLVALSCVLVMAVVGAALAQTDYCVAKPAGTPDTAASPHFSCVLALAWIWLGVALLSVLLALCQYVRIEHLFSPWISHSGDGNAFANLRQRNQFATLCGIGLLALLFVQQSTGPARTTTRWQALWPWLVAAVLAFGNGLSCSRTGALHWLLIACAVLCWRTSLHHKVRRLGLGALGLYAVAVVLMPWFAQLAGNASTGLWGRTLENAGGGSRLWLYSNVLELIAQKPWLGWGWRELAYAHYSTAFTHRFGELLDNAHNLPLHLAVELGVPFAVLFCGTVLVWVLRAAPWRETDATRQLAWGVLMLLGVHSLLEYPLWYGPFLMTLGLCIGLLQSRFHLQNRLLAQWNIAQIATKFIAFLILASATYASFDYHRVSQIYLSTELRHAAYKNNTLDIALDSVLFQRQARFAELVTMPVSASSAPHVLSRSADLVHFSPEPRVIEALIESATMLHFDDVAMFHLARYKEMYPKDYAAWSAQKLR